MTVCRDASNGRGLTNMTSFEPVIPVDSPAFQDAIRAQADAADPSRSAWVEANAGSGKTKVLIDRVARLLLRRPDGRAGARPDSILCLTYTKAAANEMLSRLFDRLGTWSIASDDKLRAQLSQLEGREAATYDQSALEQARSLFARALETPGGLRIETIHAFCARVLRRFPLEANIPAGFQELDETQAASLWREVIDTHVEMIAETQADALAILSEAARGRGVITSLDLLKSPEVGALRFLTRRDKTRSLRDEIRAELGAGPQTPSEILAAAMGDDLPRSAIHEALQELSAYPDVPKNRKLYDGLMEVLNAGDQRAAFETYLTTIAGAKWEWSSKSNPFTTALKGGVTETLYIRKTDGLGPEGREISRLKAVHAAYSQAVILERTTALLEIGGPLIQHYQKLKAERGLLDFDDLIANTLQLLNTSSMAQWVLYKLDGDISHILVDEAQDTSPDQWQLINALVGEFHSGEAAARRGDPRTQFVVGDPKQSIYSFQGADQEEFLAQKTSFESQQESLLNQPNMPEMAMSFRSSPEILTYVDAVQTAAPIDQTAVNPGDKAGIAISPHTARRENQPGQVELWPLVVKADKDNQSNWDAPIDHIPPQAPGRLLATKIATAVAEMIRNGETVWRENSNRQWQRQAVRPADILILVRRRNILFDSIIDELKRHNIPVGGADRLKILDSLAVQDCLNLIRFVLQPDDDLTLAEILRGPFCGLVDDDRYLFPVAFGRAKTESLWQSLQNQTDDRFAPAIAFCNNLLASKHLPAFEFLNLHLHGEASENMNGWDQLIARLGEPARDPVQALLNRALDYDLNEAASLQAFLANTEANHSEIKRDLADASGFVRVMTVHGAKGLQAPVVILPDTTKGTEKTDRQIFVGPNGVPLYVQKTINDSDVTRAARTRQDEANERESRRLLYVAMTRAQDRLIICGAATGKTKNGFSDTAWYRYCMLAMSRLLNQNIPATGPENRLIFGAESPQSSRTKPTRPDRSDPPDWLDKAVADTRRDQRLAAPSKLFSSDSAVTAPISDARRFGLRRGRLIHSLLQILPDLPEAERRRRAETFMARAADLSREEQAEIIDVTFSTFEHPGFGAIFSKSGRSEVAIAGKLTNGLRISGRVDRLIIENDTVFIIDFKSDRPCPPDHSQIDISHKGQMAAYADILSNIYPTHTIRCGLLYTDGPVLIELETDDLRAILNRSNSSI